MTISVVIPALNEASLIDATLASIATQTPPWEILVVDGGSTDGTVSKCISQATVLHAEQGRARQMNHGWRAACGETVFFLHADTALPEKAFDCIREVLSDPCAESGTFRLKFDTRGPILDFYGMCTALDLPFICFGDRGLFVRRSVLEAVEGFPDIPIFEDLQLVRLLHRRGGFRFLSIPVTTSARRYTQEGALRRQLKNTLLWAGYWLGKDPGHLAHYYLGHRE